MFTGSGSSLTSLECYLSTSAALVTTCAQWYALQSPFSPYLFVCLSVSLCIRINFEVHAVTKSWELLMQMTVLTVYIFLYGRVYLVSSQRHFFFSLQSHDVLKENKLMSCMPRFLTSIQIIWCCWFFPIALVLHM